MMAIVYAQLILKGAKTLADVPVLIRKDVEMYLEIMEVKL